jgi:hypothetical protein
LQQVEKLRTTSGLITLVQPVEAVETEMLEDLVEQMEVAAAQQTVEREQVAEQVAPEMY